MRSRRAGTQRGEPAAAESSPDPRNPDRVDRRSRLQDLQLIDDEIRAPPSANTEDQLNGLPQYDQSMYQEVDDDLPIHRSDFAAFESDDD